MKVAVIGGGPAGMMSAIVAAENGAEVTLFEKNEKLGKKMYISGKGRCNITNNCSPREFMANVVNGEKFLIGAVNKFSPYDTLDFCARLGLDIKTERGNRVFPCSDKSSDVIKAFVREVQRLGVKICLNYNMIDVTFTENDVLLTTITDIIAFDRVIIATGGLSYSATGCTGDGYKFAQKCGHNVVKQRPALCRILCDGVENLEGLSLKNIRVGIVDEMGGGIADEFGEMLFTRDGVSGPAVLTLSSQVNNLCLSKCFVTVDLKPALEYDKLDARILRDFADRMNKDFINALDGLLPERLVCEVARQSGIPFNKKVNQITAEQRHKLVFALKNLRFPFVRLDDIEYAIVTAGGVDVKEINPSTMESRKQKNLYFAGEVMDVDAYTGGFNIQIALSTGYVAGKSAANG